MKRVAFSFFFFFFRSLFFFLFLLFSAFFHSSQKSLNTKEDGDERAEQREMRQREEFSFFYIWTFKSRTAK
jgi:hypothetical protein